MNEDSWAILESQYKEIIELFEQGRSKQEIEEKLGISFDGWKERAEQLPELAEEIAKSTSKYISVMNKSIWKLATGYEYEERTVTEKILPSGEIERTITTTKRYKHPDLEACKTVLGYIGKILAEEDKPTSQTESKSSSSTSPKATHPHLNYGKAMHKAGNPKGSAT